MHTSDWPINKEHKAFWQIGTQTLCIRDLHITGGCAAGRVLHNPSLTGRFDLKPSQNL